MHENKPKLQPKPISYSERPWQEHMKKGANRSSSQPELKEEKPGMSEAHAKAYNYLA